MINLNLRLDTVPEELLDDFSIVAKYYAGRICSCVASNHGSYDPKCGCIGGFRYQQPVEYRLLRTSIRYDKITEKAGQILQGGCLLTIPKFVDKNNAQITGRVNLSNGLDLSNEYKLKIGINNDAAIEINCKNDALDEHNVQIQTIIENINKALGEGIAYETDNKGDIGCGYITIRSLIVGEQSKVKILKPSDSDATSKILGLSAYSYPYIYTWRNSGIIYYPVYHSLSIGDVFVMKNRYFRDSAICQKGINDIIRAFDIRSVEIVSKGDIIYKRNVDYIVNGNVITWLNSGNMPENGEFYSVEHLLPLQYIVFNDMGADRGADEDQPAKKVMAALRNYINAQSLIIDNLKE